MLASVKNNDDPPEEMSGSGMPFGGNQRKHHADVEEGLQQDAWW